MLPRNGRSMAKQQRGMKTEGKKQGVTKAELTFLSCKNWIGFGFAAVILTAYMLFFHNYADTEGIKLSVVMISVITALALLALAGAQALMNGVRPRTKGFAALWSSVSVSQKLLALYFLVCVISFYVSPYFGSANLWEGTSRGEGLRSQLLYGAIFFIAANCVKKHMDWLLLGFSAAATVFSVIGLLQAFGLGFGALSSEFPVQAFYTTVGNKNMVSAVLCLALAALMGALVIWEDRRRLWLTAPFLLIMWFMFVIENDSGIVGVGALMLVLPILCWNTAQRVSRGAFAYALVAIAFFLWRVLPFSDGPGTVPVFAFGTMAALGLCVAAVLLAFSWGMDKLTSKINWQKKTWTILWASLIVSLLIVAAAVFMSLKLGPQNGFMYEFQEMLRGNFDDSFGSGRIYAWKRTLALVPHTPVFGFGPDGYAIAFNEVNYYESTYVNKVVFDFAHNEYLQMLINYGWPGLITYLATMFSVAVRAIRRKERSPFIVIFALAAFTYCVQAFFSFAHMIMTPIFWACLGLTEACICISDKEMPEKLQAI